MRYGSRSLVALLACFAALVVTPAQARAATCKLSPKKLDSFERVYRLSSPTPDWLFTVTGPQTVYARYQQTTVDKDGNPKMAWVFVRPDADRGQFAKLVSKEPAKYNTAIPFRGVVRFGDKDYAFALDAADADAPCYGLLYFDRNGNGDLTDDGVLESVQTQKDRQPQAEAQKEGAEKAKTEAASGTDADAPATDKKADKKTVKKAVATKKIVATFRGSRPGYPSRRQFPPVDLRIEVDGEQVDYRFFATVYSALREELAYVNASFNAGVYYEGQIELDGRQRRVVLLDFNSNGRFDDATTIEEYRADRRVPARFYPRPGDVLLLDPKPIRSMTQLRDPSAVDFRHNIEKLISHEGRYYDLKVSPSGGQVSIRPSEVPLGAVKNPAATYAAVLHGDLGTISIKGVKDEPVPVPAGEWRLLSVSIELPEAEKTDKSEKSEADKAADEELLKRQKVLDTALKAAQAKKNEDQIRRIRSLQTALVAARNAPKKSSAKAVGTSDGRPIAVAAGQTTTLPFGPPYKPSVLPRSYERNGDAIRLALTLSGAGGEVLTAMQVNGARPPVPKFRILDPSNEVVAEGDFRYG